MPMDDSVITPFIYNIKIQLLNQLYVAVRYLIKHPDVDDDSNQYTPPSMIASTIGWYRSIYKQFGDKNNDQTISLRECIFLLIGQILSTFNLLMKRSPGFMESLTSYETISVFIPTYIVLLKYYDNFCTSSYIKENYLSQNPYTTPVLNCFLSISQIMNAVIPSLPLETVETCVCSTFLSVDLMEMLEDHTDSVYPSTFIKVLLMFIGKYFFTSLGLAHILSPSPYFLKVYSNYCKQLIWLLLPNTKWNEVINQTLKVELKYVSTIASTFNYIQRIPVNPSYLHRLQLFHGLLGCLGGIENIYALGSVVTLNTGVFKQDCTVTMFNTDTNTQRNQHLDLNHEIVYVVNDNTKEGVWINDMTKLSPRLEHFPSDSFLNNKDILLALSGLIEVSPVSNKAKFPLLLSTTQLAICMFLDFFFIL